MGFTSFFDNFVQIVILLIAWLIIVISFFPHGDPAVRQLDRVQADDACRIRPGALRTLRAAAPFLAEKVLGNVVSSGVKVLVLRRYRRHRLDDLRPVHQRLQQSANDWTTPLTLILAALSLLGLSIFGPGNRQTA